MEAVRRMQEKTPGARGNRLVNAPVRDNTRRARTCVYA